MNFILRQTTCAIGTNLVLYGILEHCESIGAIRHHLMMTVTFYGKMQKKFQFHELHYLLTL